MKNFFLFGILKTQIVFFYHIEDKLILPPRSNDDFGKWQYILNPLCVTNALIRPQTGLNMVLKDYFSQPYSEYDVCAWA